MTATGHAVIGTVIAAQIGNPILAIPIALGSHILADMFPHWDPGVNRDKKSRNRFISEAVIDVVSGLIVTFLLVSIFFPSTDLIYAFAVVFAAQFFDWAGAPYLFLGVKNPPIFYWIYKFQKQFDRGEDTLFGKVGQAAAVAFLVIIATLI